MKIQRGHFPGQGERGLATVIFLVLLAIMVILVTAESSSVIRLHREVKSLEQQQLRRLNGSQTNTVAVPVNESK